MHLQEILNNEYERSASDIHLNSHLALLKGYCTVFQHALKLLEITGIVLTQRTSKTEKKNLKG